MRILPVFPAALVAALGLAGPAPAWAASPVVIDGADEDVREAILDLLPDRERPTTLFEAERIAEEAAGRALAWLRSEGYYGARVTPEASENEARLLIAPGVRFRFAAPQIRYEGSAPNALAAASVREATSAVAEGAPARAAAVLEAEAAALSALTHAGYADAQAETRRVVVDHAQASVAVEYRFNAGAIAYLGQVRAESEVLRPSFISRLQNWREGQTYAPERLARLRRDLAGTGAVSRVNTHLGPADENGLRDVLIEYEPARRNAYELGVSYSTTEGAGVVGQWTRRNFTGRADPLVVSATLSELLQGANIEWTRPHAAGLGRAISIGVGASREDTEAYLRRGVALYAGIDASPRLRVGRGYGVRLSADEYESAGDISTAYVLSGHASLRRNTTGFTFDPREGSIIDLRIEPSISAGDATVGFVRATAEGRLYESFGAEDRLTLAARLRTGWLEPVSGSAEDVPPDRRFYAGGGGSVRGYEYNSIYPIERRRLAQAPGGQGLLEGSLEARWRFGERWGAAFFVDGGNAFDAWREAGDFLWGAGFGLRYDLGFAPLRADIAFPLSDAVPRDDYALYISLGQAF